LVVGQSTISVAELR
jgi:hypothetical protein